MLGQMTCVPGTRSGDPRDREQAVAGSSPLEPSLMNTCPSYAFLPRLPRRYRPRWRRAG